uniref:Putative kinetoplast-associated protein n=1 Tax=Trypanosoma congolense (strain IL3000) TaxID=1068625 RepID=G0USZ6_TRYCI|nr:putative kinetoplast-associated protein [Trypanosoma congolense IL3000]
MERKRAAAEQNAALARQKQQERKKKLEKYRKQVLARHRAVQKESGATSLAAAAAAQGVADTPLVNTPQYAATEEPSIAPAPPSEASLIAEALTFPSGNVTVEHFDENQLVVRRKSLDDPWDIGLRFDWSVKTLAIASLPSYRASDPRRLHPFMRVYQSKAVWFLEEVNGTKANNIREVMEVLKRTLNARFVFRK